MLKISTNRNWYNLGNGTFVCIRNISSVGIKNILGIDSYWVSCGSDTITIKEDIYNELLTRLELRE